MFRLAHLSDIHLGPLPDLAYRDLVSKRITGYINWRRNRRTNLHEGIIDAIVDDIHASKVDHIAVSGDLMNLALDGEVALSTLWLETLGKPNDVSVVPGNHDAYVPRALDKACAAWARWMHGDGMKEPARRGSFPYMRVRGPMALIGVSSARATAPFMASGFFGESQAERLGHMLDEARSNGLCRVIIIHHPPVRGADPAHKRLLGIGRFQDVMRAHGAELILHGHTHKPTTHWIGGRDSDIPVVGVAAAGQGPGGRRPPGQYNLIEIGGEQNAWRIALTRRGLSDTNGEVHTIGEEKLAG
ncbi:metallophosphoesterase [Mesorhizobium microcysteis]|uniref:Metallophosphoesterase n=1 Tax=Neoaquamicrobium microcysteis TaxID=2682781 RepID=A0A5D4GMC7_9HYPH|nr:metallophosphoesterase [Mesorhizobium microcysteis]TYR29976.1 metallophosphoesterase [Mesorhizobium microcysteis]